MKYTRLFRFLLLSVAVLFLTPFAAAQTLKQ
jgi:hypothetical protein